MSSATLSTNERTSFDFRLAATCTTITFGKNKEKNQYNAHAQNSMTDGKSLKEQTRQLTRQNYKAVSF